MSGRAWTVDEIDAVKARYPHETCEVIAEDINRSLRSVYQAALKFGIKKSPEFMASKQSGKYDGLRGMPTRFKPGHETWNKGMKGLDIGGKETRFKKGCLQGRAAEIKKPIGYERVCKDGYLERKINNDLPFKNRWRAVHIIVWESVNGQLPKGHAIVFKDGNKRNFDIENLECISRADLMKRNTVHNYPKELALAIQLQGALRRKINGK